MSHTPINAVSFGEDSMPNAADLVGLAEIMQMCCLSRRSGQISFRSGESSGFVYLLHGRVIHALCGQLEGADAVYRMLSWRPGTYTLSEDVVPQNHTIVMTWEQLILEGARRADQGIDRVPEAAAPVITFAPVTSSRSATRADLPKIILNLPGEAPSVYELKAEYTHVGRASGNEVPLADPSVSNRHCIFILHGSDVVLRDLNSSNGTMVNGQHISEVALRPGDGIQIGVVEVKFEPAVRRPKLTQALPEYGDRSSLSQVSNQLPSRTTLKLPDASSRKTATPIRNDSAFVKGESAISYENIPKPEEPKKRKPVLLFVFATIVILLALAGGYYFLFLRH